MSAPASFSNAFIRQAPVTSPRVLVPFQEPAGGCGGRRPSPGRRAGAGASGRGAERPRVPICDERHTGGERLTGQAPSTGTREPRAWGRPPSAPRLFPRARRCASGSSPEVRGACTSVHGNFVCPPSGAGQAALRTPSHAESVTRAELARQRPRVARLCSAGAPRLLPTHLERGFGCGKGDGRFVAAVSRVPARGRTFHSAQQRLKAELCGVRRRRAWVGPGGRLGGRRRDGVGVGGRGRSRCEVDATAREPQPQGTSKPAGERTDLPAAHRGGRSQSVCRQAGTAAAQLRAARGRQRGPEPTGTWAHLGGGEKRQLSVSGGRAGPAKGWGGGWGGVGKAWGTGAWAGGVCGGQSRGHTRSCRGNWACGDQGQEVGCTGGYPPLKADQPFLLWGLYVESEPCPTLLPCL